jgi:ankyrin repeat protein
MYELSDVCCERNSDPAKQRKQIEKLLKGGADIHERDKNGVSALHHAVRFRSVAAVLTLLEHGANANQACKRSGGTPLHRAVTSTGAPATAGKQAEAKEIIKALLQFGANPKIKNKNGKTPADYVRDEEIRRLLTARRRKQSR